MRARLAFAISMVIEFDCFLIDEIVAVGDLEADEGATVAVIGALVIGLGHGTAGQQQERERQDDSKS